MATAGCGRPNPTIGGWPDQTFEAVDGVWYPDGVSVGVSLTGVWALLPATGSEGAADLTKWLGDFCIYTTRPNRLESRQPHAGVD
jgi:hypothetical protein